MSDYHETDRAVQVLAVLALGLYVDKQLLDQLRQYVAATIPRLCRGASYKIQGLVPKEFWSALPNGTKSILGRALAQLVASGQLQLEFVGCPGCKPKLYRTMG